MIPYFQITQIMIGPIPVYVWGGLVALGMLTALMVSRRVASIYGVSREVVTDLSFWVIVSSLLGGRIVYVISEWQRYEGQLSELVKVWEGGMSITGGFAGAFLAGWLYLRKKEESFLTLSEIIVLGLPLGLFIGRLGCLFIFDHPGAPTSFFLGQEYADGIVRHNHGLYLSLNGLFIATIFWLVWKKFGRLTTGTYTALFLSIYGIIRFFLDFFRATDLVSSDARFLGLTVAQYGALLMIVAGGYLWYSIKRKDAYAESTKKTNSKKDLS